MGVVAPPIKEILPELNGSLATTKGNLSKAGYEIAYGDSYTLDEIKRAIEDRQPVAVSIDGKTALLVGLTERNELIPYQNGMTPDSPPAIPDDEFNSKFNGRAVIVVSSEGEKLGQKGSGYQIIWTPEQDSWDPEHNEAKGRAKAILADLAGVEAAALPSHPAIITFKKPDPDKKAENGVPEDEIRGCMIGPSIQVMDHEDPVTVALHEIGHMFYDTRLSEDDKNAIADLKKRMPDQHPLMVTGGWHKDKTGCEMFCDIYMWALKGKLLNAGYSDILRARCPEGYTLIQSIFDRSRDKEQQEKAVTESVSEYRSMAKRLAVGLDHMTEYRPVQASFMGKAVTVAKARVTRPDVFVPETEATLIRELRGGRTAEKVLEGRVIILKADRRPDWDYMLQNPKFRSIKPPRPRRARIEKAEPQEQMDLFSVSPEQPARESWWRRLVNVRR